jgi:hypothetical protein
MKPTLTPLVLGAALIALPASALAQTTPPPSAQPAAQQPAAQDQHPAAEHLAKAKAALDEIEPTSVTGTAKARLAELKRHVSSLDRAVAAPAAGKSGQAKSAERSWATDVAAIDRILTELTTPSTSAADPAAPTGTSGRAQASVAVDEATRAKLLDVQKHITAFAAAMSGTAASPASPSAATPSTDPTTAQPPAGTQPPATTQPPPTAQPPATQPPPTTQPPTTQPPATQPPTAQPPTTQPPATQPPTTQPTIPADPSTAGATPDPDAARRHLTEARDVLSALTQLPEAAALTGDARIQVTGLITNFNELITTQTDWRESYAKLQANLTALVGAERTDEANVPPPATGTAGAVGTSGMTTLDPKVRDKLVEFRAKLLAFEKAAGGEVKK